MAAPKLTAAQRLELLTWLAADYSSAVIQHWIAQSNTRRQQLLAADAAADADIPEAWPRLSRQTLSYYRQRHKAQLATLRAERHRAAFDQGLALKAERIARLKAHADDLELIKWEADANGRLWNEKVWRETLDDIAREMGHRRVGVDLTLERELEAFLDRLRDNLDEATYARVLALAAGSAADSD